MQKIDLQKISNCVWQIPKHGKMRVPARIYATEKLLENIFLDKAPQQAMHVAQLPGIVKYSLAMPDMHWGYGFPIGGVAAFDAADGIISPGGVGYDINCGVRLMTCKLTREEVRPRLKPLIDSLFAAVPTGVGKGGDIKISSKTLRKVAKHGARWAVEQGYGTEADLAFIEENGQIDLADPYAVSARAWERGKKQLGTLGSGNHFLEVGYVTEVYDERAAQLLGLVKDQITVIIHCGSRGFGYQICDDSLEIMDQATGKYGISVPDRQLACAPLHSSEGRAYLGAMGCAINYAFANRQIIASQTRHVFEKVFKKKPHEIGMRVVYEIAHNIAKYENHTIDGKTREVCVHRKGATRAFGPGTAEIPNRYQSIGQPVLIPGDMGRYSYVLLGTEQAMAATFGSTCHGAGRALSRKKAKKAAHGRDIFNELRQRGIHVRGASQRTLDEEIPEAYKDVSHVVEACVNAGISKKVAKLRPMGCIKG